MRIYDQAVETVKRTDAKPGDLIVPFNYRRITNGICPTLTTRPEGLVLRQEKVPVKLRFIY